MSASSSSNRPTEPLAFERATRLLSSIGIARPRRPVELLIGRLCRDDALQWIEAATRSPSIGGTEQAILSPDARLTRQQLVTIKDEAKRLHGRAEGPEARLAARLRYFFALALALEQHDELISDRSGEDVALALQDLADVAPEPWRATLAGAAGRARDKADA